MWTYNSTNGNLSRNGELVGTGYAGGDKGRRPDGVNNPSLQNVPDVGPLPQGKYTIGDFLDRPIVGEFAAPLSADPDNLMFGRAEFYIHGDTEEMNQSASDGCIILPHDVREQIASSEDNELEVV